MNTSVSVDPAAQQIAAPGAAVASNGDIALPADSKGRVLVIGEPDVLAPYRFIKVIGGEAASNEVYVNMVLPLIYLKKIDDEVIFPPNSDRELDAMIKRLGKEGMRTLLAGVSNYFSTAPADPNAAGKAEQAENDAIKK